MDGQGGEVETAVATDAGEARLDHDGRILGHVQEHTAHVADLEDQLRNTIIGRMTDAFAQSQVPFLDMAANQVDLGTKIAAGLAFRPLAP